MGTARSARAQIALVCTFASAALVASQAHGRSSCLDLTESLGVKSTRADQTVSALSQALSNGPAAVETALIEMQAHLKSRELLAQDITRKAVLMAGASREFPSQRLTQQIADVQRIVDQTSPAKSSLLARVASVLRRRTLDDRARLELRRAVNERDRTASEIEAENTELAALLAGVESAQTILRAESDAVDLTSSRLQGMVLRGQLSNSERSALALTVLPTLSLVQARLQQQNLALESVLVMTTQRLSANRLALDLLMRQNLALSTNSSGLNQGLDVVRTREELRRVLEEEPSVCIRRELCAGSEVVFDPPHHGPLRHARIGRVDAEGFLIDYMDGTREVLPLNRASSLSFLSPTAEHFGFRVGQRIETLKDGSARILAVNPSNGGQILTKVSYRNQYSLKDIYATEEHAPIAEYLKARYGQVFGARLRTADGLWRVIGFNPFTDLLLLEEVRSLTVMPLLMGVERKRMSVAAGSILFTGALNAREANEPLLTEDHR